MKIGFITPFFSPVAGGSATGPYYLAKYLVKKGHEVLIFTSNFGRNLAKFPDEKDLAIIESKIELKMFNLFYTPSLRSELESSNKLDILHLHNFRTYQNYVAYSYAKRTNTPYILQAHGSIPRIGKKELKWLYDVFFGYQLLRDASKVIALTQVETDQYRHMGISEEKIAIVPNGIDLSEYAELPPKGSFKKKFGIPENMKIIFYLGRIHKIKGIDLLIRAYAHLKNVMKYRGAILVIAGPDDGYLSDAKALAYTLGVPDSVVFVGPLYSVDKLAAYVDSDLCVLPSRYETFPIALLEVYACSKPIVASNLQGLKELIVDGETGLLFEAGNFKQMAEKMAYLLNDNNKATEIGMKARGLVEERYSMDRVVDNLEELYMEIADRDP
jgi:glycosyltransferase involved in cell wall biosynthesis